MSPSTLKPGSMFTEEDYNALRKPGELKQLEAEPQSEQRGSRDKAGTRFDLICPTMLYELAETMTEGAKHYGVANWTKGLSKSNLLNHTIEHLLNELYGDEGENHLAHAIANLMMLIHFRKDCHCHESFERDPE